jgi:amino acid transporter
MIFAGVIIGLVILAAMVYLAFDKKSTLPIRLASLGAIAVMFIAVIICLIVVLSDKTIPIDPSTLIVGAPVEIKEEKNNSLAIILSVVFIVALFVFIAILAMKEYKKNLPKTNDVDISDGKSISNW